MSGWEQAKARLTEALDGGWLGDGEAADVSVLLAEVARLRVELHDIEDTPCLPSEPTALLLRKMARAALAPEVKP